MLKQRCGMTKGRRGFLGFGHTSMRDKRFRAAKAAIMACQATWQMLVDLPRSGKCCQLPAKQTLGMAANHDSNDSAKCTTIPGQHGDMIHADTQEMSGSHRLQSWGLRKTQPCGTVSRLPGYYFVLALSLTLGSWVYEHGQADARADSLLWGEI